MDENMNGPHVARTFMHNTFWVENQISFTFELPFEAQDREKDLIDDLNLQGLDAFHRLNGFYLITFSDQEDRRQRRSGLPLLDILALKPGPGRLKYLSPGIYEFPDSQAKILRVVIFFRFGIIAEKFDGGAPSQPVPLLIELVNSQLSVLNGDGIPEGKVIPITSAAPNWLCGASGGDAVIATGCPLLPPIPVPGDAYCADAPGLWPIRLPDLPRDLKRSTGDGVNVLVLDTLPKRENITRAAQAAGAHNLLLLDLENNVKFSYPIMHDLDNPNPSQAATGKDVNGRLIGFRMPDHGLFVAGIIRDLVPDAHVECIRVLNDWCVGTAQFLIDQLAAILDRVQLADGDLFQKNVVVNLSLVIPDDANVIGAGIPANNVPFIRENLFFAVQALADRGVIIAASAGNEGDQRYQPSATRPNALYPAEFANDKDPRLLKPYNIIPVGAVNKDGDATSYSCYPGPAGIATYGGEVPAKENLLKDGNRIAIKDPAALDAVIGVYTSLSYPALYYNDPEPTYPIPNAHGWAYWVGTSFATPIASAIAARTLELNKRTSHPILSPDPIIFPAATDSTLWSNLSPTSSTHAGMAGMSGAEGLVIRAVQCGPHKNSSDCKKNRGCSCSCCKKEN